MLIAVGTRSANRLANGWYCWKVGIFFPQGVTSTECVCRNPRHVHQCTCTNSVLRFQQCLWALRQQACACLSSTIPGRSRLVDQRIGVVGQGALCGGLA
ncbi:hypothetical protein E4U23_008526 [Claviceps purpurea]|nr:hypothetical protein E4U23_008526 [Claviceps purpurea]